MCVLFILLKNKSVQEKRSVRETGVTRSLSSGKYIMSDVEEMCHHCVAVLTRVTKIQN